MFWRFMFFVASFSLAVDWLADAQERPADHFLISDPQQWTGLSIAMAGVWTICGLWALFRGFE